MARKTTGKTTPSAKPPLTGRSGKDVAMDRMREIANRGGVTGWTHALAIFENEGSDGGVLRIWAGATDRNEIDMICERWRRAQPKRRR